MPLKILHNLCFSSLLGITAVPREIENNDYAKFGGQISCIMGDVQVAYNCTIDVNCIDVDKLLPNLVVACRISWGVYKRVNILNE